MKNLLISITAILVAIILGGSYFGVQYYKQKSIEKQQLIKIEAEDKEKEEETIIEKQQKNSLQRCLREAETDYWDYMEINGTKKADGTIWAEDRFWDRAEKNKNDAIDNCNEQYRNKSFGIPFLK